MAGDSADQIKAWRPSEILREVSIMKRPLSLLAALSLFAILLGVAAAPSPRRPGFAGLAKSIISYFSVRSVMAAPRSGILREA